METNDRGGKQSREKVIEDLALRALRGMDLELVGIEYKPYKGRAHLTVYIDKSGGIFLEDCERVSKSLGELLDREDPIARSYVLEVSSPGLERPLKKKTDFERFTGNYIRIKTFSKINGQKNFIGKLMGLQNDALLLQIDEGRTLNISLKDISKANLFFE